MKNLRRFAALVVWCAFVYFGYYLGTIAIPMAIKESSPYIIIAYAMACMGLLGLAFLSTDQILGNH